MFRKVLPLTFLTGALSAAIVSLGNAQTQTTPPAPQAFRPSFGDMMTMTVQPRHIKLWLAGQEKNWVYATYELHEMEEAFENLARVQPMYRTSNVTELLAATMKAPMDAVGEAIKSANAAKFTEAYAQLTATCNACHQSTEHPFVVIQVPKASSFPNQDFRPAKP
jgi:hypothetical protein